MIIFVFGSNLAGRHGKGAALYAKKHFGAIQGKGHGIQGESYAIPTKDKELNTLPLNKIEVYIDRFLKYATDNMYDDNGEVNDDIYLLTPIGTGLAGYKKTEIIALLKGKTVPDNVVFSKEWFNL